MDEPLGALRNIEAGAGFPGDRRASGGLGAFEAPSSLDGYARLLEPIVPVLADHLLAHRPGKVHHLAVGLFERALFEHVLKTAGGNQLKAARLLGLNRNTVRKRGRELKLLPARPPRRSRRGAPGGGAAAEGSAESA